MVGRGGCECDSYRGSGDGSNVDEGMGTSHGIRECRPVERGGTQQRSLQTADCAGVSRRFMSRHRAVGAGSNLSIGRRSVLI